MDDVRSVLDTKKEESPKGDSPFGAKTKPKARTKPKPKPVKRSSIKKKAASASITDILGFNPKTKINEGVPNFVNWYLKYFIFNFHFNNGAKYSTLCSSGPLIFLNMSPPEIR